MTWDQFWEHVRGHYQVWPTPQILAFEAVVLIGAVLTLRFLGPRIEHAGRHFLLLGIGVLLVELFTSPMWEVRGMGPWAYIYSDVSWIYTLAWTSLILLVVYGVDVVMRVPRAWQRFALYLLILTPLTLIFEAVGRGLGIRGYSPETLTAAGPLRVPLLDVPLAGLYYVPVFMGLVLSFYKHWLPALEPGAANGRRPSWPRRLGLLIVGVLLFEIVVEPMAINQGFPSWSYIYHDITLFMTGFWVALVGGCFLIVDRLMRGSEFRLRFAGLLALITAVAIPVEGWFLNSGLRVYAPSAQEHFIGIRTLIGNLPLEVVAAVPIYLSLVIAFVRCWDGSVDQSVGMRRRTVPAGEPRPASLVDGRPADAPT